MTFAWNRSCALFALVGTAAALAAPVRAADDKSTLGAVGELVGISSDPSAASIDYRERPKLVLPPRNSRAAAPLPTPKAESSRPENWPTNAAAVQHRNSDRFARVPNAPAPEEEPKAGVLDGLMGKNDAAQSTSSNAKEPARRMLTEPPAAYRRPTMDLSTLPDKESEKKGGSWWNPMTYVGGGGGGNGGAEAPAQPSGAVTANQAQQTSGKSSGSSSSWFHMPRFLAGDSKEIKD
jgi:hypothetical protein